MWESFKLFFKGIFKKAYYWIPPIFLDPFDLYKLYLKQLLPIRYQMDINMPSNWGLLAFILMIIWAGIMTYHELRKARWKELYKYMPEANRDRIFRIFYELHKLGKFEQNSSPERRQQWDENVFKEIKNYCAIEFEWRYLSHTGRRNQEYTPLHDDDYGKALSEIKSLLDNFDSYIKI